MNILVVGGAGYVGGGIVDKLSKDYLRYLSNYIRKKIT